VTLAGAISHRTHPGRRRWLGVFVFAGLLATQAGAWAQTNSALTYVAQPGGLGDTGSSVLRVFGALLLVTAVFLGGVWLFRNWQRLSVRKNGAPRLNVLEVKSLGQRQAIYVVGYDQQRMLLASSPSGVAFLSHLPSAEEQPAAATAPVAGAPGRPTFADAFQQVLGRKP
jgi:flagellar biogenesis protein FliO